MIVYSIIGICIFILIIILLVIVKKYLYYKSKYKIEKKMNLYYKNKLSMLEYHFRNYREGKNPYTILRNIGDILQDYYLKLGSNKGSNDE